MSNWREIPEQKFINPYNFVQLDASCLRSRINREIDRSTITGWIECTLTNESLLFIPNTTNGDAFALRDARGDQIKNYDFFSYDNIGGQNRGGRYSQPVIPGSEIRGVIHSAFETVTASCMSAIDEEKMLYKRTSSPSPECGRLFYDRDYGDWLFEFCYKAGVNSRHGNKDKTPPFDLRNYQEGQEVFVTLGEPYGGRRYMYRVVTKMMKSYNGKFEQFYDEEKHHSGNVYRGYLHKGEPFGRRKHHEAVFIPFDEAYERLDIEEVERLRANILLYGDDKVNIAKRSGNHNGYEQIGIDDETPLEQLDGALVYYTCREDLCYISPACISREVFANRIRDLIGDFTPCTDADHLCAACSLFGMVGEENACASRLRFTDAKPVITRDAADYYYQEVVLPELASPKPSATEFYLFKNNSQHHLWNYDYAGSWQREFVVDKRYKPRIRGRKYYWHQQLTTIDGIADRHATIRHIKVRPLLPQNSFHFRIYFDRVQENELAKLLWVLRPGADNYHKIGMGKPLGLGSIRIDISAIKIRKLARGDEDIRYQILDHSPQQYALPENDRHRALGCSAKVLEQFLRITDWRQKPAHVSYPKAIDKKGNESIYSWFVGNKQIQARRATEPLIYQSLPSIEKELGLAMYKEDNQRNRSSQQNRRR